ncbi:signal peptidase I [Propionicicella superfundia]|uniref:signal peptidase I n=1 Tax=Propionicicella superfundia TaxID=348582 RepID=UPI00146ADAF2|nr:signal peptidase I [Propionicicella superfundia]
MKHDPGRVRVDTPRRSAEEGRGSLSLPWRVWSVVRSVILTLAAALGVVCLVAFGVSFLVGVRPLVVISGSMEPAIPTGSVVFTRTVPAAELAVGDVVTVERPRVGGLVTHRIVAMEPGDSGSYELTLQGDANRTPDSSTYTVSEAGRYMWHVPYLGNVALVLQSRGGILTVVAAGLLLIAVFLLDPASFHHRRARRTRSRDDT